MQGEYPVGQYVGAGALLAVYYMYEYWYVTLIVLALMVVVGLVISSRE